MGFTSLVVFLVVGGVAGWLASLIVKGNGMGILMNIIVGIAGGFIAGFLLPALGFELGGGTLAAILHSMIGAVVLLFGLKLIKGAKS